MGFCSVIWVQKMELKSLLVFWLSVILLPKSFVKRLILSFPFLSFLPTLSLFLSLSFPFSLSPLFFLSSFFLLSLSFSFPSFGNILQTDCMKVGTQISVFNAWKSVNWFIRFLRICLPKVWPCVT